MEFPWFSLVPIIQSHLMAPFFPSVFSVRFPAPPQKMIADALG